ncbi:hypothetical protein MHU86_24293 [Fragilaria crotonensis]|nr:hypothetical protein MHU86_24293 [Fragilaria crotonensis]
MGLKWRSALYHAESLSLLNDGQYGSRPHRNAIDPVFIEELQFEISRLTRKTLVQTNYDAASCYDRIVPNLAMVASQTFGVPPSVTASNARTLKHARYHIRTEMGLAEESYTHSNTHPIYGTGQGSGNSPAIWCFLSSLLYDCYDQKAAKATYKNPSTSETVELGMVGFVDDSNGQTNLFDHEETENARHQIITQLENNAQLWAELLGISGGALEPSKCSYHVMAWQFTVTGAPILMTDSSQFKGVRVKDPASGIDQELTYLSPYASHKTLGHYKDPAGTQREQYRQLKSKSDNSVEFLYQCSLTPEEAWTFYYACYLPSIGYPLANSHFTAAQLNNIQRKAMSIIIAKCGYNRNTKRAIIYGPLEYGGANFRRLYDQQGIGQVQLFLRHWRNKTTAGRLLRCAVAWAQYCVGTSLPLMENVYDNLRIWNPNG